jgi:alpha-glucosidase
MAKKQKLLVALVISILFSANIYGQQTKQKVLEIPVVDNVAWWSGVISQGDIMPVKNGYSADFTLNNYGNQVQPMLISNDGQVVWSEKPFKIVCENNTLKVTSETPSLEYSKPGETLKDAFIFASKNYFPAKGELPDELLFSAPQFNTWIELMYDQNQKDIMKYAHRIIDNGFPPGVLMIDDNWQEDYGKWDFHCGRFSNPKAMVDSLHEMGFKVMLWICPFISPDCDVYRKLESQQLLLKNNTGKTAMVRWWNGVSGLLDLSNPETRKWFKEQLDLLQNSYGVDGFKFDAGDFPHYANCYSGETKTSPQEQCEWYARIGLDYPLNEYRAMWKMAGYPLANRLRDKSHNWRDLTRLIPHILLQGIVGYNFTCPDMVGGGEFISFLPGKKIDQDLIVRSAQCHALMPMMQFSVAPWRILDEKHFAACKEAVKIREEFTPEILKLAKESAKTGEPIVRSMEYVFPHRGYEKTDDQFMLGDNILVAPIVTKGNSRKIKIPEGNWKNRNGKIITGPKTIKVNAGIKEIPIFTKMD